MVSNLLAEVLTAEAPDTTPPPAYAAYQRQSSLLFHPVLMVLLSWWLWSKGRAPKQDDNWENPEFFRQNLFSLEQTILIRSKTSKEECSRLQTPRFYFFPWKQAASREEQDQRWGHFGLQAQGKRDPETFPKHCKALNYPVDTAYPTPFIFQ